MTTKNMAVRTRESIAACHALGLGFWSGHPSPNTMWAVDDAGRPHEVRIIRSKMGQAAEHFCGKSYRHDADGKIRDVIPCADAGRRKSFIVPSTLNDTINLIGSTNNEEETVAVAKTAPAKTAPAKAAPAKAAPAKKSTVFTPRYGKRVEPAARTTADQIKEAMSKSAVKRGLSSAAYSAPTVFSMTQDAAIKLIHHDPEYLEDIDNMNLVEALGKTPYDARIKAELKRRGLTPARIRKQAS